MDEENKDLVISPEEQKADDEMTREVNEDELVEKLADEMGLDPDEDSELLNKLLEREKSHREKLSGAIKQKIKYRDLVKSTSEKPEDNPKGGKPPKQETPDIDKLVDQKLNERLEERDLKSLKLPEDIEAEVKDLAKLKGISVREAAQLPYIVQRIEEAKKEEAILENTPRRKNKGSYTSSIDPSKPLDPEDYDLNTEKGRKLWNEAKALREKYRTENK